MHDMRAENCRGLTSHEAGVHLRKLASEIPGNLCIVEIGVYLGRSLLYMAEGSMLGSRIPVYGVDPFDLPRLSKDKYKDPEVYQYARDVVALSPASSLINLVRDFGTNVAKQWKGPKVGLWYLDSDHRYGPVMQDVKDWSPHFAPGAILVFDDYASDFPGVIRAVDELYDREKIRDLHIPEGLERTAVAKWGKGE